MHAVQINFQMPPSGMTSAELLDAWPSLVDIAEAAASAGVRVSVVQMAHRADRVERRGVDYHFVAAGERTSSGTRGQQCARLIGSLGADVLHVHGLNFADDTYALSQLLPATPVLVQDHADRPPRWWRRPRWQHRHAAVAGVSFTAPELAQPFFNTGLLRTGTRVFTIPESSTRFRPGTQSDAQASLGMSGDPCAVWVGHLSSGKDPLTVLEGFALAMPFVPGLQLWCLYGDAPLLPQVRRRIDDDPLLAGRVHLRGKVDHAAIETYLRAADLFVSGSHAESCGYALLEAMACGVLPVVTSIPSFRALAGPVAHFWQRGHARALQRALVEASRAQPNRREVRAHFERELSLEAVGRRWAEAYLELAAGSERRFG